MNSLNIIFEQGQLSMTAPSQAIPVIALDAMGGDYAPQEIVKGAVLGAKAFKVAVELVGDQSLIEKELALYDTTSLDIRIVHTPDVIDMDEAPAIALRKKKNASIALAARRVKEGYAQGFVAAGSTGAAMTAALFNIGRLEGIDRPAIGVALPQQGDVPCLLLDGGANADCSYEHLVQFALMGQAYMAGVYKIQQPTVGLLNIGSEEGKGNKFSKEAFDVLKSQSIVNFIGNVEGRNLFLGGCNVIVCDGFTGNVALKSAEGMVTLFGRLLKTAFSESWSSKLLGLLVRPILQQAKKKLDHEELGGALLLGIKGICIIAHGGSSANAIKNAIGLAQKAVQANVLETMTAHAKTLVVTQQQRSVEANSTVAEGDTAHA